VLLHEKVVKEYETEVALEDIVAGLIQASDQEGTLSVEDTPVKSSAGQTEIKMSVSDAQRVINDWRAGAETIDERFLKAYRDRRDTHEEPSGLLWRKLEDNALSESFENCMKNPFEPQEKKDKQLCYLQLKLNEASVCNITDASYNKSLAISGREMTYGHFEKDEVISGWAEAFDLIDVELDREDSKTVYLEIVTPPELAYGTKGLPGRVEPNETLWFILAVKNETTVN